MHQPAWQPTYSTISLDAVDLDGDTVVCGTKKDLLKLCREHHIHRASITPYETRFSRGYVIQGSGNRRTNTVCLLTTDMDWRHYRTKPPFTGYTPFTQLRDLGMLLDRLAEDYTEGSPTRALTEALTEVVRLWAAAAHAGRSHIDTRELDQALAVRLNPHLHAWLYPITQHDEHERFAEFDDETGRYLGSRHLPR